MSGGSAERQNKGQPPASFNNVGMHSAYIGVGSRVKFTAITKTHDATGQTRTERSNFVYEGEVVKDNEDGSYDIMPDRELSSVQRVPYQWIMRPDGTLVRYKRPQPPPGTASGGVKRRAQGSGREYEWRHDGIWSSFVEERAADAPYAEMQDRMKFRVESSLKVRGRWVAAPVEVWSMREIMEAETAEERDLHLRALAEFHADLFHAHASPNEFKEWLGEVDAMGPVLSDLQAARDAVYAQHAPFAQAHQPEAGPSGEE
jgi:hypothetical protein